MQDPLHGPNPLRPYYIPPSIGETASQSINATAAASKSTATSTSPSFSLPSLDYSDYIPDASPSAIGSVRGLLDQAVWKYTSVVLAQPFEVAKIILQCRIAQESDLDEAPRSQPGSRTGSIHAQEYHEESDEDEPNFFSSSGQFGATRTPSPPRGRRGRPTASRQSSQRSNIPQQHSDTLDLHNSHSLVDALSALSLKSGSLSIWRGTNTTFIYTVLNSTLETFFKSFLAAMFGIAEQDVLLSTPSTVPDAAVLASVVPTATILIATAAAALSAIVLAPIDAARTRLILTPSKEEPRTLLGSLRTLSPSYLIPRHLLPITFLTSTLPTLLSTTTPFFLRSYMGLDPAIHTTSWSVATFASSVLDLSIKFPLETVLRRAQIATWTGMPPTPTRSSSSSSAKQKVVSTIVQVPQSYRGVLPTIWGIVRDEGYSESAKDKTAALMGKAPRRKRKGQGIEGLYRGWRVGLWGLVGIWGSGFAGGLQGNAAPGGNGAQAGKF
ncbi:Mitochondrial fusion and transport protein ugo1 [Cyphellophora attinorum]|uniref:Mitochondrial fusion and transport protein ugo1 n=1 Tax=Cyphellophora attinorum TaxID=1664694 RepID=A0A0N1NXR7_9EURO|nr:Mitochondrial fusion and transport protein ugo1 [Phialophora attinorum]KPI35444.1 Mitochondrial fusion and transport protein ugo1 [Phialophora attinorum]